MTIQNGQEIPQEWNYVFVVFAYIISFVASYSTVHLLDHKLWKTMEEKHVIILKCPRLVAALIMGFGAVWSMHFVGMAAVTLEGGIVQCYDWPITLGSMAAAIIFIFGGLKLASRDEFAGANRLENLKMILRKNPHVTSLKRSPVALRVIQRTVLFHNLTYIVSGGMLAAIGAVVMHYTGMMALHGPFRKEWSIAYLATSVVIAVVVCVVGFWILFRLRWKAKQFWLRYLSAAVLAFAICGLHFFGMLSVRYIADDTIDDTCGHYLLKDEDPNMVVSPNSWSSHQLIVVAVSLTVPLIAVVVENLINQELLLAYRKTVDPDFAQFFAISTSRSGSHVESSHSHNNNEHSVKVIDPKQQKKGSIRISGLDPKACEQVRDIELGASATAVDYGGSSSNNDTEGIGGDEEHNHGHEELNNSKVKHVSMTGEVG